MFGFVVAWTKAIIYSILYCIVYCVYENTKFYRLGISLTKFLHLLSKLLFNHTKSFTVENIYRYHLGPKQFLNI